MLINRTLFVFLRNILQKQFETNYLKVLIKYNSHENNKSKQSANKSKV